MGELRYVGKDVDTSGHVKIVDLTLQFILLVELGRQLGENRGIIEEGLVFVRSLGLSKNSITGGRKEVLVSVRHWLLTLRCRR